MERQNIIYIHTHDSGNYFSPYGYRVPTDGLMEFSKDATLFSNAFCASPTCSPSRSALTTGQYPHKNGMLGLANRGFCLTDYKKHMVTLFQENGYLTALCGIQHEYGRYTDHKGGAETIGYELDLSADCSGLSEKDMVLWDENNVGNLESWMREYSRERPFFLSFGFFSTHREYPDLFLDNRSLKDSSANGYPTKDSLPKNSPSACPETLEQFPEVYEDLQGHIESLRLFDKNFTRIINALKENGLYENTVIIFTTDHGIPFPRAKCTLYDAGIHVALLMRVPNTVQGQHLDQLISHVDLVPTLCSLLKLNHGNDFDGLDFSALFQNPDQQIRQEIFAEVNFHTSYEPIRCIRTSKYKYIRYYDESYLKQNISNIDNSPSKDIYMKHGLLNQQKAPEQFYDLTADPGEKHNLINDPDYQHEIKDLKRRLYQIQLSTNDPILQGPIPIHRNWVVNTNECVNPKSKVMSDFL